MGAVVPPNDALDWTREEPGRAVAANRPVVKAIERMIKADEIRRHLDYREDSAGSIMSRQEWTRKMWRVSPNSTIWSMPR